MAERAGLPLVIAGIVQDREYFERFVEPRLDGAQVTYIGPVGPELRGDLLAGARALLHLIDFEEPFGYSVVEAMACGTPVIANARGSMPEIVRQGEGGYLVHSLDEAVAAVQSSAHLDRLAGARLGGAALRRGADGGRVSRGLSTHRRGSAQAGQRERRCPQLSRSRMSASGMAAMPLPRSEKP